MLHQLTDTKIITSLISPPSPPTKKKNKIKTCNQIQVVIKFRYVVIVLLILPVIFLVRKKKRTNTKVYQLTEAVLINYILNLLFVVQKRTSWHG